MNCYFGGDGSPQPSSGDSVNRPYLSVSAKESVDLFKPKVLLWVVVVWVALVQQGYCPKQMRGIPLNRSNWNHLLAKIAPAHPAIGARKSFAQVNH